MDGRSRDYYRYKKQQAFMISLIYEASIEEQEWRPVIWWFLYLTLLFISEKN